MSDDLTRALENLKSALPAPRTNLSEAEKDAVVARVGPRTASAITRARKEFPLARIPFLFSTIDTQSVVDILANDMTAAIARALVKRR